MQCGSAVQNARLGLLTLLLVWPSAGCGQGSQADDAAGELRRLGKLPGARQSTNAALRDELFHLEEEAATPEQLVGALPSDAFDRADILAELFTRSEVQRILETAEQTLPPQRFEFPPLALQQAIRTADRYADRWDKVWRAFQGVPVRFRVDYLSGFAIERWFVDLCEACHTLGAFRTAQRLAQGEPSKAMYDVEGMMNICRALAAHQHVEARLTAARLRERTFRAVQSLVRRPETTREDLAKLRELVNAQLASWPYDGDAWIGDRAQVLHSYELLREGYSAAVLTSDERAAIGDPQELVDFCVAAQRGADGDELFYLQTMRKIINSCRTPYYQRKTIFAEIRQQLNDQRSTPQYPLAAARLFLPDIEEGHQIQALDRSLIECWAIALALGLDAKRPPLTIDPYSGEAYRVKIEPTRVLVSASEALGDPIVVPRIPAGAVKQPAGDESENVQKLKWEPRRRGGHGEPATPGAAQEEIGIPSEPANR